MSMTFPTLSYPNPSLKISAFSRLRVNSRYQTVPFCSLPTKTRSFNPKPGQDFPGFSWKTLGFVFERKLAVCASAGNAGVDDDEAERAARGESTMPERFRYLTKEAPDPPVRWPWFVALAFLVYAWRAVLLELANWRKAALGIISFAGYLLKVALAIVFHFIGDPITSLIRCVETALYTIRSFYSGIVAYAPVRELTIIILLASAVLAIAEAVVPNSVSCQPHLLTVSGLLGYAAVSGYISEPLFWTLLLLLCGFSRFVKKRDDVSSALPAAAVLAAVGEPWVRVLVMASYLALAISHHSKKILEEEKEEVEVVPVHRRLPLPLLGVALAIGIRLAANWAGYRHLTWKIV
ncbi:uncharacterized protein LOC121250716 [Juglans microcarpa x Juglans regia]|uniref:uncharacterized protein LOC121250716 n=1 Tax=Juglans microcarpa x Juglans regia TaxID=2249226 RepID=UPI001B7EE613|nr:uncharacterized protein LOC121250716 [Juglans microcarpa x Juglans regia]